MDLGEFNELDQDTLHLIAVFLKHIADCPVCGDEGINKCEFTKEIDQSMGEIMEAREWPSS